MDKPSAKENARASYLDVPRPDVRGLGKEPRESKAFGGRKLLGFNVSHPPGHQVIPDKKKYQKKTVLVPPPLFCFCFLGERFMGDQRWAFRTKIITNTWLVSSCFLRDVLWVSDKRWSIPDRRLLYTNSVPPWLFLFRGTFWWVINVEHSWHKKTRKNKLFLFHSLFSSFFNTWLTLSIPDTESQNSSDFPWCFLSITWSLLWVINVEHSWHRKAKQFWLPSGFLLVSSNVYTHEWSTLSVTDTKRQKLFFISHWFLLVFGNAHLSDETQTQ